MDSGSSTFMRALLQSLNLARIMFLEHREDSKSIAIKYLVLAQSMITVIRDLAGPAYFSDDCQVESSALSTFLGECQVSLSKIIDSGSDKGLVDLTAKVRALCTMAEALMESQKWRTELIDPKLARAMEGLPAEVR